VDTEKHSQSIAALGPNCIAVRLRLLNRVVTKMYDDELRSLGLKVSQLNVLVVTARLGLARPGQICSLLRLDTSTLSRGVERMRARGWLEVVPGDDGRMQSLRLTVRGKKLLERTVPAYEAAQKRARELLGPEGLDLLNKMAKKLGMLQSKS